MGGDEETHQGRSLALARRSQRDRLLRTRLAGSCVLADLRETTRLWFVVRLGGPFVMSLAILALDVAMYPGEESGESDGAFALRILTWVVGIGIVRMFLRRELPG